MTRGYEALVDDEDYEELNRYKWYAVLSRNIHYAKRRGHIKEGETTERIEMSHAVLKPNIISKIDHKDGNGLNNQRNNIRIATNAQNGANRSKISNNGSSKYKGVRLLRTNAKGETFWQARVTYVHIGVFSNEIEAAKAYDKAATKFYGEFARLNFPKDVSV